MEALSTPDSSLTAQPVIVPRIPSYQSTRETLITFEIWCATGTPSTNAMRARAHWMRQWAEAFRPGSHAASPGSFGDYLAMEYEREVEDSVSLSPGDDPDADGDEEGAW